MVKFYTPLALKYYMNTLIFLESLPSYLKARSQSRNKVSEQIKYDIKSFYQEAYSNHFYVYI